MKHLLKLTTGLLFLAGNFPAQAQFGAPGALTPAFDHALVDVLAQGPSFYGRAKVQLPNGPDKEPATIFCDIAFLWGSMRIEADAAQEVANLSLLEAAKQKQMHSFTIVRPDKNRMYMVFPNISSYLELAYSKATGTDPAPPAKISTTSLGKEAVGDQPCSKSQLDVTENSGEHFAITVWSATNWNNFPIQIKIGAPPIVVDFLDLHLNAPDGNIFVPPANYTKYEGIQELIQRDAEKAQNAPAP